ncbi:type I-E CRISPR-associated protein Cse1/CasA (plasmid) [Streptomyces sp. NBC_00464]|uniref:type I-E CRISPR-associated protein Cse1/CasA n=1 Tax=Streptomyces sp. NBC_00464 TaxID=2975751 RepID=UPI002E171C6F
MGFDVRDEPWIPVRLREPVQAGAVGERSVRLGLRELFRRAHEIVDLEVPLPPSASGLLRILAALTARIASHGGVRLDDVDVAEDVEDWVRLRAQVLEAGRFDADAVDAYFDDVALAGRFDVFDPVRPFLQDPRLVEQCVDKKGKPNPSGINKLVFGRPTGVNGAVLFGHFNDGDPVPVPAAEALWHLIGQLYYGPAGQCTPRQITAERAGSGDAGPLRKTVSFHPWAPDLFTSLVLSVPVPGAGGVDADEDDACPWEADALPDPLGPAAPATWPGHLLTGRARHAVLLVPAGHQMVGDAYVSWSTHAPASDVRDPFLVLDRPRNGEGPDFPRLANGRRALWRDLDALLLKDVPGQSKRPLILQDVPRSIAPMLRVRAYGFDQDGQQRDSGWYEATTPPVLGWQEDVDAAQALRVRACRQAAEEIGDRLSFAARLAWKLTTDGGEDMAEKVRLDRKKPGPWDSRALAVFWPRAEQVFWTLLTTDGANSAPHRPFADAALDALDDAIGTMRADVRVARARNRARRTIRTAVPRPAPAA